MSKAKKIEVKQVETQAVSIPVKVCEHNNQLDKGAGVIVCNDCGSNL